MIQTKSMNQLRLTSFTLAFAAMTLVLLPFQWLFVQLGSEAGKRLPLFYHRVMCKLLRVRVSTEGSVPVDKPMLILSNHVSWLDIVVLSQVLPVSFVAKTQVGEWPIFGTLARLQRTIFVNREQRSKTRQTNTELGQRLVKGDAVVLFAEGTTSDGLRILPFRSPLVGAVREALMSGHREDSLMVQPVCILYTHRHGLPLTRSDMPQIGWYGDMELLPHLITVITHGPLDVLIRFGEPIAFTAESDRKEITRQAEAEVRRLFTAGRASQQ
jgi:1-acyl-sn-glycerol-3-phosphate acyltransferase